MCCDLLFKFLLSCGQCGENIRLTVDGKINSSQNATTCHKKKKKKMPISEYCAKMRILVIELAIVGKIVLNEDLYHHTIIDFTETMSLW